MDGFREIILIKNGEIALKGLNRSTFEDVLIKNLRRHLQPYGDFKITKAQSTIAVEPPDGADLEGVCAAVSKVFGIAGYSRAAAMPKDIDAILRCAPAYLENELNEARTFKVEARRADKSFPLTSPELCTLLGERILKRFPHLSVDVHSPDVTVTVEVRDSCAFARGNQLKGAGGLPTGTAGRACVLISGGIDSPVASYMIAKRGVQLAAVHFASPPYTSVRAEQKVHGLLGKIASYCGSICLFTVPFTEIQENIRDKCPEDYFTLIMRRFMMRIAELTAQGDNCDALVTGESIGQVASQTMPAIVCTDAVTSMPVFRPLIGMDKDEIVRISRKIDTFDISIEPYEDCCTVFTPKHPKTRPHLSEVEAAESALDIDGLIARALENKTKKIIGAERD